MYPKKSSSSIKSNKENNKLREREQLRSLISQKLSVKYEKQNPQRIEREVKRMLESGEGRLTKEGLAKLEEKLGGEKTLSEHTDNSQVDNLSVKSGLSKMTGATGFQHFEKQSQYMQQNQQQEVDVNSNSAHSHSKKILKMHQEREEDDLNFLDENNQWAAIMKYNNYMFQKEQHFKQIRGHQQKKEFRSDLDEQIRLKKVRQEQEARVEQQYINNMKKQIELDEEKDIQKNYDQKCKIEQEKIERQKQMKDLKQRRRSDMRQEKQLDNYYLEKLKEEMEREKEYDLQKKSHQMKVTQKLLIENEEKQERGRQQVEKERLENIELMDAYIRLVNEQEAKRDKDLKTREDRIKVISQQHQGVVQQEQEDKIQKILGRQQKYEERKEKKKAQVDEQLERDKKEAIYKNRDYLMQQMEEKEERKTIDLTQRREQSGMWRVDEQKFREDEEKKDKMRSSIMKEYKGHLEQQMATNQNYKNDQQLLGIMSQQEQMLNRKLNSEIQHLKNTLH